MEWHVGGTEAIFLVVLGSEEAFAAEWREETQMFLQAGPQTH